MAVTYEEVPCECGCHYIVNRTHWKCDRCNQIRLHGEDVFKKKFEKIKSTPKKIYSFKRKAVKSSKKTKEKRKNLLGKDRELYFYIFSNKLPECENCETPLPEEFEDEEGNLIAIWQYSHILGKGAYPEYRHHKLNINRLCFDCHQIWEFGTEKEKSKMKIWKGNLVLIDLIRSNATLHTTASADSQNRKNEKKE